ESRLSAEGFEKLEFLRAQRDHALADVDFMARRIDAHVPDDDGAAAPGHAHGAPQDRAYARHELLRVEGLRHVVVHAGLEGFDLLEILRTRGKREHRRVRVFAYLAQEIEPVRVGKPEVED